MNFRILIQPTIKTFNDYKKYADRHNFAFEIIDFSFPSTMNGNYQKVAAKYKKRLKGTSLGVQHHGLFKDLYINSSDKLIKKASEKRIYQNLSIAHKLGANSVVFHTNFLPLIHHKSYLELWSATHAAFWKKVIKKYNITVLLENLWDPSPDHILDMINKVKSKKLGVCFDTGHYNVFSKVPMEQWFKKLGKHILCLHINDNKGDRDSELAPGEGTVNWKKFDYLVKRYCNKPAVVLEVDNLPAIERSAAYLKKAKVYPFSQRRAMRT